MSSSFRTGPDGITKLNKLTRSASKARKIAARAIRKIHVPAYCPVDLGVQAIEKSGVVVDEKNVMAMSLMPIMLLEEDISIEPVGVAMFIPDIAAVGMSAVVMVIPSMFIVTRCMITSDLYRNLC